MVQLHPHSLQLLVERLNLHTLLLKLLCQPFLLLLLLVYRGEEPLQALDPASGKAGLAQGLPRSLEIEATR